MEDRESERDEQDAIRRAWMTAAQGGDATAYDRLLRDLLPRARRLVAARIRDHAAQEDVVQNAFISIHRARHTYRPDQPFSPWFHAIVRNATTDWLRSHARRAEREIPLEPEREATAVADAPARERISPDLERALASLPPKQREAVELIQVEDLSVVKAAARAGISAGALKVRAHRGYRALRGLLGRGSDPK